VLTTLRKAEYAELMILFFIQAAAMAIWFVPLGTILDANGMHAIKPYAFAANALVGDSIRFGRLMYYRKLVRQTLLEGMYAALGKGQQVWCLHGVAEHPSVHARRSDRLFDDRRGIHLQRVDLSIRHALFERTDLSQDLLHLNHVRSVRVGESAADALGSDERPINLWLRHSPSLHAIRVSLLV
jgi:hypothetical protein